MWLHLSFLDCPRGSPESWKRKDKRREQKKEREKEKGREKEKEKKMKNIKIVQRVKIRRK